MAKRSKKRKANGHGISVKSSDTLAKNPECWVGHNNLGNVLFQKGQVDDAMAQALARQRAARK